MTILYIVVEETGEYSHFNRENKVFFTDEKAARAYCELQEELYIGARIDDVCRGSASYVVEECTEGGDASELDDTIYVVVKDDSYEYHCVKENVIYYNSYEGAKAYISSQKGKFVIDKVQIGPVVLDIEISTARESRLKKEAEIEAQWKIKREQLRVEELMKKQEEKRELMDNVNTFLDWWESGVKGDTFFNEKKAAKFRSIRKDMVHYMSFADDARVKDWCARNQDLFGDNKDIVNEEPFVPYNGWSASLISQ